MKEELVEKYGEIFMELFAQALPLNGEDNKKIKISDLENNLKEVFFGLTTAFHSTFVFLTAEEVDILQFSYFINNLIVENLIENGRLIDPSKESIFKEDY